MYGDKAAELLALYPAATDADAMRQAEEIGRNSGFTLGARAWAREQTRTGKESAYLFIVSRVQPFTPGVTFSDFNPATAGAYHMGDVPYFLGTYEAFNLFRRTRDWTPWDRELSNALQDVVVAFARTGSPSTRVVQFTRYALDNETRVDFGDAIKSREAEYESAGLPRDDPDGAGRGRTRPRQRRRGTSARAPRPRRSAPSRRRPRAAARSRRPGACG